MIKDTVRLSYLGKQAQDLRVALEWAEKRLESLPFPNKEKILDRIFDGNWATWRLLIERFEADPVELLVIDAVRFKELMAILLTREAQTFSSEIGQLMSPLLYDISNLVHGEKKPGQAGLSLVVAPRR